jgi:polysaccharide chain length determinant protein (PEP-CTERM system associated)
MAQARELAQAVNSQLTSLFIDENLQSQQQQSESTTAFLESQLASARSQLQEQEDKVQAFKAKHFGDLPSQLESNVQILAGLQTQLDNDQRALDGAKQQKLYLQSLLQQYQMSQGGDTPATEPEVLDKELLKLRTELADDRTRYTDDFPTIVRLKQKIDETEALKKKVEADIAGQQKTDASATADGTASGADDVQYESSAPMMEVRSQLKANELQIQNYQRDITEAKSQIAAYRTRLNLTPATEQELADVSRGYEESKTNYNSLLQKLSQSQLATSLEQRQQGEQFRIIDPPNLPDKPSFPNHFRISLVGLAVGLGIGLGLAALLELMDVRVWHEKDLEGLVPGRLLVGIPHLASQQEGHSRVVRRWLEIGLVASMTIVMMLGNLYAFHKG